MKITKKIELQDEIYILKIILFIVMYYMLLLKKLVSYTTRR